MVSPHEAVLSLELLFAHGGTGLCFIFCLLLEDGAFLPLAVHPNSAETTGLLDCFSVFSPETVGCVLLIRCTQVKNQAPLSINSQACVNSRLQGGCAT